MLLVRVRARGVALLCAVALASCTTALGSVQPPGVSVYAMSSGRVGALVAGLVGLSGVVIGALTLLRSAGRIGTGNGRLGAIVAALAGLSGVALGGLVVATSSGGVGTGNGLGGAIVAMVLGLISIVLGGLAVARSRRLG